VSGVPPVTTACTSSDEGGVVAADEVFLRIADRRERGTKGMDGNEYGLVNR
jgi:hypothetical protein